MTALKRLPVAAALLCGLVFAFAFPETNWLQPGFCALIGFVVCFLRAETRKAAFLTGYAFGAGQFLINFFWIANAFAVREGFSYIQGLFAVTALALALAVYPAVACLAAFIVNNRASGRAPGHYERIAVLSIAWFLAEYARAYLFTGFPWNPIGAMWGDYLPVAQSAALLGVYGLSAVTVLAAGLCAGALGSKLTGVKRAAFPASGLGLVAVLAGYGYWHIPSVDQPTFDDLEIVLVQANIAQEDKWKPRLLGDHLRRHVALSNAHQTEPQKRRLVIWPEASYPYVIDTDPVAQLDLQAALGKDTTLIFGANRFIGRGPEVMARNSLFVLQDGAIRGRYDKMHLVPFGEYIPFADVIKSLGVSTFIDSLIGFEPGQEMSLIDVPGVPKFAPLICYEGIFPRHLRGLEGAPQWILNISNDAWFGLSSGPAQHLNLVRFRAIEHGTAVVRATGTGITAVIDPYGRIFKQAHPNSEQTLVSALPKPRSRGIFRVDLGGSHVLVIIVLIGGTILFARSFK